jgi:hypothetical protein
MRSSRKLLTVVVAGLALGACDDATTSGPDTGRLTIQLTDAPGDLAEAYIKIDEFVLIGAPGDTTAAGRISLQPEEGGYIDLLTLAGGKMLEIVDAAAVPAGTYSELRLVLDEAYVRLEDGRVFATAGATLPTGTTAAGVLKCPSCSQSGFKVKFVNGGLQVGSDSNVLIDFDVAQSFGHEAGKSGMWIMKPVLRATATTVRLGSIRGQVSLATGVTLPACGTQPPSLALFKPRAIMGNDTITGTTDTLGVFRIANALPGTYALGSIGDISFTNGDTLTFTSTVAPSTVTVVQGDSVAAAYQITAAACH